eukprot:Nk52_evm41s239 gene=Nk52_evmTU41s239
MGKNVHIFGRSRTKFIFAFACGTRLFIFALQLFVRLVLSSYDSSSSELLLGARGVINQTGGKVLDHVVYFLFGGFCNWDSVYFINIALNGYETENATAFFPLYPLLMRLVAQVLLFPLALVLSPLARTVIAGVLISNGAFVIAAVLLFRLGLNIFKTCKELALMSALMFCVNPASIFFSAIYSESLFALLTFGGMFFTSMRRYWEATVLFALCSATRGNGFLCAGFLVYDFILRFRLTWEKVFVGLPRILLCVGVVFFPFALFQYYLYTIYCTNSSPRPFCSNLPPLIYLFVQKHYWGNGFLQYYNLKQAPNFLLAFPTAFLASWSIYEYINGDIKYLLTIGLRPRKPFVPKKNSMVATKVDRMKNEVHVKAKVSYIGSRVFVYVVYLTALLVFCLCNMHVQVMTRFLFASCPSLYWYAGLLALRYAQRRNLFFVRLSLTLMFFVGYSVIGTVLHCAFYPWT